jgi:hypothetical protein
MSSPITIDDPRTGSRATFVWEHPEGFKAPLVRVRLEYADEFSVSARILPPGRTLLRFLENLNSLGLEGTFEERTFRDAEQQLEICCRPGSREVRIIVCHVSLASDWDDQRWRVTLRLEIEVSRLPTVVAQFRDFLAQEATP